MRDARATHPHDGMLTTIAPPRDQIPNGPGRAATLEANLAAIGAAGAVLAEVVALYVVLRRFGVQARDLESVTMLFAMIAGPLVVGIVATTPIGARLRTLGDSDFGYRAARSWPAYVGFFLAVQVVVSLALATRAAPSVPVTIGLAVGGALAGRLMAFAVRTLRGVKA